jgi:hypothetical protein
LKNTVSHAASMPYSCICLGTLLHGAFTGSFGLLAWLSMLVL